MNLQTVIACAVIIAGFLLYRRFRRQPDEQPYIDALELADDIRDLCGTLEQLESAQRMSCDLYACAPGELHRVFRTNWMSSDGKSRSLDLWADGSSRTSAYLTAAADAERDRLNAEIIDRIRALYARIDGAPVTAQEPLPDDMNDDEHAGQSGKNSGRNDVRRRRRGSA